MDGIIDLDDAVSNATQDVQAPPRFALKQFNRKIPSPSLLMHPPDGNRYRCAWIEDSLTIHSDGNVTCGLDDPNAQRSFGNVNSQTLEEITRNPEYDRLRQKLWEGHRCTQCSLFQRADADAPPPPRAHAIPRTLVIEPSLKCNIRCLNSACYANNDAAIRTRDGEIMSLEMFCAVIDQMAPGLAHVYFFNYGDPFVNARAEDMLAYLREQCPEVDVVTSTNGIPLAKDGRALRVVQSGLNCIVFTIGGIHQDTYSRYHVRGRADLALRGMQNICVAKTMLGRATPHVVWRYLLFRWNDGIEEVDAAIALAAEYGVNHFILYLTHEPREGASYRFAPGTPNFTKYRKHLECALGYTRHAGIPQPDARGYFEVEDMEFLGPARWTSWHCRLAPTPDRAFVHVSVSTNRPAAQDAPNHALILTPWRRYKVPLRFREWQDLSIEVPPEHRNGGEPIVLVTYDHWFPADELDSPDLRCLGVIVREGPPPPEWDVPKRAGRTRQLPLPDDADLWMLDEFPPDTPAALDDDTGGRTWT